MRVSHVALIVGLMVFGIAGVSWAHEGLTKESPKLIYTQGKATRAVPVDGVRLIFKFPVEGGSFEAAGQAGRTLVEGIRQRLGSLEGAKLSVVHSWDLVRQATISWGTKGKRIDHNFAVELEGIAPGRLHALVAQVIDQALQAHDKVELERIEVYLTEAAEAAARAALHQEAAKTALASAQGIAAASGAQMIGPRYLAAGSELSSPTAAGPSGYFSSERLMKQSLSEMEIRKSFRVRGDVPDQLDLSASVVGAYEIQ